MIQTSPRSWTASSAHTSAAAHRSFAISTRRRGKRSAITPATGANRPPIARKPKASRPARRLLAWLALHPGRQPRTHVAAQLWPDVHPDSARTSLRAALASLRRSVGDDADGLLVVDREAIGLAPGVEVDRDRPGELAPGLPGEWLANERDRHRTRSSRSLAAAVSALEADGDLAAAAAHA